MPGVYFIEIFCPVLSTSLSISQNLFGKSTSIVYTILLQNIFLFNCLVFRMDISDQVWFSTSDQ